MSRILRRIAVVVLAGAVVVIMTALGTGRIHYVSTHGVSMVPTYHDGELVAVARSGTYRVGDIVAYRNPGDGVVVLHRIVGGDAHGWQIRGDNNQSIDVAHPTSHELLGRAVAHVPGLGRFIASPLAMGIGGAAAVLCVLGGVSLVSRRRPSTSAVSPANSVSAVPRVRRRRRGRVRWSKVGLVTMDVITVCALVVALVFRVHPASPAPLIEQRGTFRYEGTAPESDTYPDGRIVTGDAVFTRLATHVTVHFDFDLDFGTEAAAPDVSGTLGLELQLANRTGWRRTTPLVPQTSITDGRSSLSAGLDLASIQAQIDRIAEESGVPSAGVDIVVRATARVSIPLAAAETATEFELPLQLTPMALTLVTGGVMSGTLTDTDDGPALVVQHPLQTSAPAPASSGLVTDGQRRVIFFSLLGAVALTFALWPPAGSPLAEPRRPPDPAPAPDPDLELALSSAPIVTEDVARILRPEGRREPRTGHVTGSFPDGIACDGSNVWVANSGSNTVSQIDPVAHTRTEHIAGDRPRGLALDGTNVWVANSDGNTISRIHPGTAVRTDFPTGDGPQCLTHDGTHVWVTNSRSNTVSRIDPRTGVGIEYTVGPNPAGIAFDGWYVWVANFGGDTVTRLDPREPAPGCGVQYTVGPNPMGVAFDGQHIWVANFGGDTVSCLDPRDAAPGRAVHHPVGLNPRGLAWDGTSMWATNFSSGTVSKIDPAGAEPGTAVTYATGSHPCGISSDGTSIWVTNFSANTVSVIHARQPHPHPQPAPGSAQVVAPSGALSTANNREHISND